MNIMFSSFEKLFDQMGFDFETFNNDQNNSNIFYGEFLFSQSLEWTGTQFHFIKEKSLFQIAIQILCR